VIRRSRPRVGGGILSESAAATAEVNVGWATPWSVQTFEDVSQDDGAGRSRRPRDEEPQAADNAVPSIGLSGLVEDHVVLAAMLLESGDDPVRDTSAVHDHPDVLVRDATHRRPTSWSACPDCFETATSRERQGGGAPDARSSRQSGVRSGMGLLGHSAIAVTMNAYSHVVLDMQREGLGKIGAMYDPLPSTAAVK
jgi:hypothetical protein